MHYDAVAFLESLFRQPDDPEGSAGPDPDIRVDDLDPAWRIEWEERAAIREYDGGLSREHAEALALADIIARMRCGVRYPGE